MQPQAQQKRRYSALNIVRAKPEHVDRWIPLAKEFYGEGFDEYQWGFDEKDARTTYEIFVNYHIGYLAFDKTELIGCFGGIISPHHFNFAFTYCQEMMWYVKPTYRGNHVALLLLEAAMKEAAARGCRRFVLGHTGRVFPEKMKMLYSYLGFQHFETHYIKEL